MLRDVAMYWRDWILSPELVTSYLIEEEDRGALAFAGLLFGVLFMLFHQIINIFISGGAVVLTGMAVAIAYVLFIFVLDVLFLQTATSLAGSDLQLPDMFVISGFAASTTFLMFLLLPFRFIHEGIHAVIVLPLTVAVHWAYIIASMKGASGQPWGHILVFSLVSALLVGASFVGGIFLYYTF